MARRILMNLLTLCVWSAAGTAFAQDPAPANVMQEFQGFYVGGNIGFSSYTAGRNDQDGFFTDNSGWTLQQDSFAGGVQAGFDLQLDNAVVGLAFDYNLTSLTPGLQDNSNAGFGVFNLVESDMMWYATIRLRGGLAITRVFLYVTAGLAVTEIETKWIDINQGVFEDKSTRYGWAGGFGAEFKIAEMFGVGGEFLYMQFGTERESFVDRFGTRFTFGHIDSAWVFRLTINFRPRF